MKNKLPSLLFISGMPGVGKSTLAHKILEENPEYVIKEEIDLIREALRGYVNNNINIMNVSLEYKKIINSPSYELTFEEFLSQCAILNPSLIKICERLQYKHIPAIIEGVNLDFVSMFYNQQLAFSDYLCINLHISNKRMYYNRLANKYKNNNIEPLVKKITSRSQMFYARLDEFISKSPQYNIYNIDLSASAFTYNEIIDYIISLT